MDLPLLRTAFGRVRRVLSLDIRWRDPARGPLAVMQTIEPDVMVMQRHAFANETAVGAVGAAPSHFHDVVTTLPALVHGPNHQPLSVVPSRRVLRRVSLVAVDRLEALFQGDPAALATMRQAQGVAFNGGGAGPGPQGGRFLYRLVTMVPLSARRPK